MRESVQMGVLVLLLSLQGQSFRAEELGHFKKSQELFFSYPRRTFCKYSSDRLRAKFRRRVFEMQWPFFFPSKQSRES